jgi:hypothetical protein
VIVGARAAREHGDLVAARGQGLDETAAEPARGSGDGDLQGLPLLARGRRAVSDDGSV